MAGNIKINPKYKPLYSDRQHFIFLVTGGRGSAKSFNVATFTERLSFEKGHKILFSRYTMTSASLSVIPEFQQKIEMDGFSEYFDVTNADITNKFSQSEIMFRGIKTSSGNQTANLKSIQGLTTFIGDELEEWQSETDFETLVLSIRQAGIQNRVILIMNPSDAEHFIYKRYIEKTHRIEVIDGVDVQMSTHPDVLHIHTTYFDNEQHLADVFLNSVASIRNEAITAATRPDGTIDKAIFNKSKYAYKIIGRWADIAEGVILPGWREGEFDESLPYCYGQDYGFSVDPDTLVRVAINHRLMLVHVDELYYDTKQLGTDDLYELNKSRIKFPKDLIVGDSAEDRLIADLKKKGLNIIECEKGPGSVVAGLTALQDYTIVVTPNSTNIKMELKKYVWNDKKAGIPIDAYNHAIDPIRYAFRQLNKGKGLGVRALSGI
jgi:phage terminase large subunit